MRKKRCPGHFQSDAEQGEKAGKSCWKTRGADNVCAVKTCPSMSMQIKEMDAGKTLSVATLVRVGTTLYNPQREQSTNLSAAFYPFPGIAPSRRLANDISVSLGLPIGPHIKERGALDYSIKSHSVEPWKAAGEITGGAHCITRGGGCLPGSSRQDITGLLGFALWSLPN